MLNRMLAFDKECCASPKQQGAICRIESLLQPAIRPKEKGSEEEEIPTQAVKMVFIEIHHTTRVSRLTFVLFFLIKHIFFARCGFSFYRFLTLSLRASLARNIRKELWETCSLISTTQCCTRRGTAVTCQLLKKLRVSYDSNGLQQQISKQERKKFRFINSYV